MLRSDAAITIPILPGDGVGPELAEAAQLCLHAVGKAAGLAFNLKEYKVGYAAYSELGNALPEDTIEALKSYPAALLGAISSKDCPAPSPMGQLRKMLGLFADIRHCFSTPGSSRQGIDIIFVRECSEGFLSDRNMFTGAGEFMPTADVVLSVRVITRQKCDQIARVAYEYAKKHGRKKMTAAHKNVVYTLGCGLFRERVLETAQGYPEILTTEEAVDSLAGNLVSHPEKYDTIVTTNMFGDILSDIVTAQVGNLVPMVNANLKGALFYPAHGAVRQLAGRQKINPLGMFYTVSMMLHWLNLKEAGDVLDEAIVKSKTTELSNSLTLPDGTVTADVTKAVIRWIEKRD